MSKFSEKFVSDFKTTKRVRDLTTQFKRTNVREFTSIEDQLRRFKGGKK